jgi:hypothetical protein
MQLRGGRVWPLRRIVMTHVVVKHEVRALKDEIWLRDARSSLDLCASLTSALAPFWTVDRQLDPSGELSVIILPVHDTDERLTFVVYEDNAVVQVSTFVGEEWRSRQSFRTCQRAVDAIIEAASAAGPSTSQPSRTSLTTRARSSVL